MCAAEDQRRHPELAEPRPNVPACECARSSSTRSAPTWPRTRRRSSPRDPDSSSSGSISPRKKWRRSNSSSTSSSLARDRVPQSLRLGGPLVRARERRAEREAANRSGRASACSSASIPPQDVPRRWIWSSPRRAAQVLELLGEDRETSSRRPGGPGPLRSRAGRRPRPAARPRAARAAGSSCGVDPGATVQTDERASVLLSCDAVPRSAERPLEESLHRDQAGRMFWFSRKTLSGSQARLRATSRWYFAAP